MSALQNSLEEASLFLMQASLGSDYKTIQSVALKGIEKWLQEQLDSPLENRDRFKTKTSEIWQVFRQKFVTNYGENAINGAGNNPALPYWLYWRMAWWHRTLAKGSENTNTSFDRFEVDQNHIVRHRVAQALSEILVISDRSILELDAEGMADFYDLLYTHAFGHYNDLLYDVSLHPTMGVYLSHMNNAKANGNVHPDENYAREIMQLFTIGLNELNSDGTEKMVNGRPVPTYDNDDIKQLAKVFTGLTAKQYLYEWTSNFQYNGQPIQFSDSVNKIHKTIPYVDMVSPMVADESYHDKTQKNLLNGRVSIPANQTTLQDIRKAVDDLVKHPNTAPFIAKKLIQQLVSSNPSNQYVKEVANEFGESGNLKEVVFKILTHPEAQKGKKLKSPLLRVTQLLKAFGVQNDSGQLWVLGDQMLEAIQQQALSSPTVFNFYLPDFKPHGEIANNNQVAPEFQLHNSATSISYVNLMYQWLFTGYLPMVSTQIHSNLSNMPENRFESLKGVPNNRLKFDFSAEVSLATQSRFDELIDRVSLLLTGTKNTEIRSQIKQAFSSYENQPEWVVQTVVFMLAISPEFSVLKARN